MISIGNYKNSEGGMQMTETGECNNNCKVDWDYIMIFTCNDETNTLKGALVNQSRLNN